jgi:hypothetical protein
MSNNIKKNITYITKIVQVLKEIDLLDTKLTKKYNRNQKELELYDAILKETNNNFNIVANNFS